MAQPKKFWAIAIISNLIKELGWSTILYTAAIAGVGSGIVRGSRN